MIRVSRLTKTYGAGESRTAALRGVSLELRDGDFAAILGASGSGKTTLLNLLSGLERPDSGQILYDSLDITTLSERERTAFRRAYVGFVFQQYYLLPHLTVEKNVRMGADLAGNRDYGTVLEALGLREKRNKYPYMLSGGEQQRVCIARALAKKPRVLFLDEPTGALDETTGRQVLDYISRLQKDLDFTAVMVTHNRNIAEMAGTVISMNSGALVEMRTNSFRKSAWQIGW